MGNEWIKPDKTNLNVTPWYDFDSVKRKLKTGDVVLLSLKSTIGTSLRWFSKSFYSSVGIVIRLNPVSDEVLILEPRIVRPSLYNTSKTNGKVTVVGSIRSFESILYSNLYDLVAVRKLKLKNKKKYYSNMQIIEVQMAREQGLLPPLTDEEQLSQQSLDPLACRLLELSMLHFEIPIHPEKYLKYYKPSFFDSKIIYGANVEDQSSIISAEYAALLFHKLHILNLGKSEAEVRQVMQKFKPKHFASTSKFELPFHHHLVRRFKNEKFIYLDTQVFLDDLTLHSTPITPTTFPLAKKSLTANCFMSECELYKLRLKTGDLICFADEGVIANGMKAMYGFPWTRVGVVVLLQGINKIFIYEPQPIYVAEYELNKPFAKLVEGRLVSLASVLASEYYSRVAVRKLRKVNPDASGSSSYDTKLNVSVAMSASKNHPFWQTILRCFSHSKEHYPPDIRVNVSDLFSAFFTAKTYMALGLLPNISSTEDCLRMYESPASFMSFSKGDPLNQLERGFILDKEIDLIQLQQNAELTTTHKALTTKNSFYQPSAPASSNLVANAYTPNYMSPTTTTTVVGNNIVIPNIPLPPPVEVVPYMM